MEQSLYAKLYLTPQLIQAMNVLQMSSFDLYDYVQEQAAVNPCMEVEFNPAFSPRRSKAGGSNVDRRERDLAEMLADPDETTLQDTLYRQLQLSRIPDAVSRVARYLAGNLDESGYLRISVEEVYSQLRIAPSLVERALAVLQSLEPAGVGARNVKECLQIQISRDDKADPWAYSIVSEYLQETADGKLQRIALALGIGIADVRQSLAYIRGLNPRPGSCFGYRPPVGIVPDAVVSKENDRYVVRINEASVPRISIDENYRRLASQAADAEAKAYIRDSLQSARSLVRSLEQRALTLGKVIEAILEEQAGFLEGGPERLKPMKLKTIADKLLLHESTVSRAIHHKFVQTPGGTFELKSWFTNGFRTETGEEQSAQSVKAKIRRLIEREPIGAPLSDQQIADALTGEGLRISRRTVMKYREALGYLSSRQRGGR